MLCPIKVNSNTIELTVNTSCFWVLDLLRVIQRTMLCLHMQPLIIRSFLFRTTIFLPHVRFEPPIARECLLEFDTRSNDLSHHGWLRHFLLKLLRLLRYNIEENSFTGLLNSGQLYVNEKLQNFISGRLVHLTKSRWPKNG